MLLPSLAHVPLLIPPAHQSEPPPSLPTQQIGETGELFQWRGEVACGLPGFSPAERQHVGEEVRAGGAGALIL